MDQTQREAKFRQISPMLLKRGKTEAEIWEIIYKKEEEAKDSIELDLLISDNKERKDAMVLMAKYLEDYSITTVSDKSDVANLIYLQILNKRIQKQFEEVSDKTNNKAFPLKVLDSLHKNHDAIAELKSKLGIRKDDPSQQSDSFKTLEQIKKKVKLWHKNNQGSRTLSCPSCGQMVLLTIRVEAWEAQKHPFFKDKILTNDHLILLYESNKISREDVGKILECSPEYTDWIIKKWGNRTKPKQLSA